MKRILLFTCALLALFALSCAPNEEETPTKGHLRALIGESVAPILAQEVNRFMSLYQSYGADVTYVVMQSKEADRHFMDDTARLIITTIPLTTEEKDRAEKTTDHLVDLVLAYDGVVALVHHGNPRNDLMLNKLRDILTGRITTWHQLGGRHEENGKIHVILEDSSDVTQYLSQRVLGGKLIREFYQRTTSSGETLKGVSSDPLSLGLVGLCWADSIDGTMKILNLGADSSDADTTYKPPPESIGNAYSPHPAHIYLNYYPMKRAIYVYARTSAADFATGFASFLASPAGQRIFLNAGMVPATQKIVLRRPEQQ